MINPDRNNRTAGFPAFLLILLLLFLLKPAINRPSSLESPAENKMYIHIEGDVKTPGVYPFDRQIGLTEVITGAGGLRHDDPPPPQFNTYTFQSSTRVNLRKKGDAWSVSKDEISAFYKLTLGIPISLNKESEEGLMAIPGIGSGLAKAIVKARIKRGGFKNLNEMMSIKGIGEKTYMKMRPYLTL